MTEGNALRGAPRIVLSATLLGIFFLGLTLRLYGLDASSLWWDEVKTVTAARLDFLPMLNFQARDSVHPPLLYMVTGSFMSLFGDSDFVVRLQAALLGALAVLLTYKLGEVLWSRREGVIGAFLLAVNAYHIHYSQEARHYSLMVFLAILSLIFLLKALKEDKKGMWVLFALCTGLNIYTHYYAFLILPGELVFAAWLIVDNWRSRRSQPERPSLHHGEPVDSRNPSIEPNDPTAYTDMTAPASRQSTTPRKQALHLGAVLALVGLSYLPWLPILQQQLAGRMIEFGGVALEQPPRAELSPEFLVQVLHEYTGLGGVFLVLFLALFVLGLANSKAGYVVLFGLWITVPFLFPFLIRSSHFFEIRYAICVVPILLLVVARGTARLTSLLVRKLQVPTHDQKWRVALDSIFVACIFGGLSVAPIRDYYLVQKTDYRGVARYLASQASAADVVLADGEGYLYGDSTTVIRNLSYYMDRFGIADMPVVAVEPGLAEAMARHVAPRGGEVWAVLLSSELATAGTEDVVATTPFERLSVAQLRRPSGDIDQDMVVMLHALTELLRASDAHFDIHLALAEFYAAMGDQEEADTQVEQAISSRPVERSAHLHIALSYVQQGRPQDAVEEYLAFFQAPSTRPDWWREREAYWGLGLAYEQLGNLEQALAAYTEVLNLDSSYWQAYRRLGDLHLGLGEPGQALAAYQRAVDLQPQNALLHFLLGRAHQSLGQIEEATLAYQQVLSIDPNNEWARAQLASFSQLVEAEIPHPLFRSLGGELVLLGYDLGPATPEEGGPVQLTLWWQALANMDKDYTAFMHLVGPDGRLLAQQDSLLEYDGLPTSDWRIGLLVKDTYLLQLPAKAAPGDYAVLVGIYDWRTGERLPAWDRQGERIPQDAIELRPTAVTSSGADG